MNGNLTLQTVDAVDKDTQAHVKASPLPIITSTHDGDVLCGNCGTAITKSAAPAFLYELFQTEQELVFECTCGALNVVPREA